MGCFSRENNNAKAFCLSFYFIFSLLRSGCFYISLPFLLSLVVFCEFKAAAFHPDSSRPRYGTVTPPHPAVSSVLHNKRPPSGDYTVQDVVDSKQGG